jgi:hypothetical protein
MFMEARATHHMPHFHAYYQEHVGVFGLNPVELIVGDLPRTQRRLSRRGRNFTGRNSKPMGSGFRPAARLCRSLRYNDS